MRSPILLDTVFPMHFKHGSSSAGRIKEWVFVNQVIFCKTLKIKYTNIYIYICISDAYDGNNCGKTAHFTNTVNKLLIIIGDDKIPTK